MHNALSQVSLICGSYTLKGFSISGLATYVQVPELDICFDMGECPLSAVPVRHVLLTHAHGDHARCLLRHRALRGMLGMQGEAVYIIPKPIIESFHALAKADALFEGVSEEDYIPPNTVSMDGGDSLYELPYRKGVFIKSFTVEHRGIPSLGYTVMNRRKKLKEIYLNLPGQEIAKLRQNGIEINDESDVPLMTFIGDCTVESLYKEKHIWKSPILMIEATFVDPSDRELAGKRGHTHIDEIGEVLREFEKEELPEHIVLKHFSMKVSKAEIAAAVERSIPDSAKSRIRIFLH